MTNTHRQLTFKHNMRLGRHGWLRLTPAYSVEVVRKLLEDVSHADRILDPFSGTGTTGLVVAERGLNATLRDINPFLVWLAKVKVHSYNADDLSTVRSAITQVLEAIETQDDIQPQWVPPLHNILRWWDASKLALLARLRQSIYTCFPDETPAKNLLLVGFCRMVIETSNAAFNHPSMSFKVQPPRETLFQKPLWQNDLKQDFGARFEEIMKEILSAAETPVLGQVSVMCGDARNVSEHVADLHDCVITSPPYPNRMSYIRELRPYMYWLGYLHQPAEAAELDWQAIGGTWGTATSRLNYWSAEGMRIPYSDFEEMLRRISDKSALLRNYVHKYFVDTWTHLNNLPKVLAKGANVFYVVGNSKFYDVEVPTADIYAHMLAEIGFMNVKVSVLRKRNSKKELFEYVVSAIKA